MTDTNQDCPLAVVVRNTGLATGKAERLLADFMPLYAETVSLLRESEGVTVTDATQVTEIKRSRVIRLRMKSLRCEVENKRKEHKADALKEGRAIDGIAGYFTDAIAPVEKRLAEQEQFAERAEAKRKEELRAARVAMLAPYGVDTNYYPLGDMPEAVFSNLLNGTKAAHEAKIEAARKAEADRIQAEKERLAEEARIRQENERLRLEAEAKERELAVERERVAAERRAEQEKAVKALELERAAAEHLRKVEADRMAAERAKIEAKAKAEREAAKAKLDAERKLRESAEAKERLRVEAERQRVLAEAEAKRKADNAPDKEKLLAFADEIDRLAQTAFLARSGKDAGLVWADANQSLKALSDRIKAEARTL